MKAKAAPNERSVILSVMRLAIRERGRRGVPARRIRDLREKMYSDCAEFSFLFETQLTAHRRTMQLKPQCRRPTKRQARGVDFFAQAPKNRESRFGPV
jgi:hypothetical protein